MAFHATSGPSRQLPRASSLGYGFTLLLCPSPHTHTLKRKDRFPYGSHPKTDRKGAHLPSTEKSLGVGSTTSVWGGGVVITSICCTPMLIIFFKMFFSIDPDSGLCTLIKTKIFHAKLRGIHTDIHLSLSCPS